MAGIAGAQFRENITAGEGSEERMALGSQKGGPEDEDADWVEKFNHCLFMLS